MSLTDKTINDFLILLCPSLPTDIITANKRRVIKQRQEGKRLSKPYATWRRISMRTIGLPSTEYDKTLTGNNKIKEQSVAYKNMSLEVQFYTDTEEQYMASCENPNLYKDSNTFVDEFIGHLYLSTSIDYQNNNGFGIHAHRELYDLDLLLNDKWERRSACELSVNYTDRTTLEVDHFTINSENDVNLTINFQ